MVPRHILAVTRQLVLTCIKKEEKVRKNEKRKEKKKRTRRRRKKKQVANFIREGLVRSAFRLMRDVMH